MGVAPVDDAVAGLQVGQELLDRLVDSLTGLHEQHDPPRPPQSRGKLGDAVRPSNRRPAPRRGAEELVRRLDGAVEYDDGIAVVVDVEDQVLAHDRQADQSEIRELIHRDAPCQPNRARDAQRPIAGFEM